MKKTGMDMEFHMPETEFLPESDRENADTKELHFRADEITLPGGQEADETPRRKYRRNFLTVGAVAMTVVVLEAANGYDVLGHDPFNDPSGYSYEHEIEIVYPDEEPEETEEAEKPDKSFPKLTNLMPGGWVDYSQQYEEYLQVTYAGTVGYLYSHNGISVTGDTELLERFSGVSYDPESNTLTLDNVRMPEGSIIANYMGNGLKLRLIGDNELGYIQIWGWGYGGSLTITGTGSLVVNQSRTADNGILLNAEFSESCLMIDSGVQLEVYGGRTSGASAIEIVSTSAAKGIYYLKPLTMTEGIRSEGKEIADFMDRAGYFYLYGKGIDLSQMTKRELEKEGKPFHDFSVTTKKGKNSGHVVFK